LARVSPGEAHEVRATLSSTPLHRSRPQDGPDSGASLQCLQHGHRIV
jgi:hypothetical protein